MKKRWWWIVAAVVVIGAGYFLWPRGYCRSAKSNYGIEVSECPDGRLRQTLQIEGVRLRRGGEGVVRVSADALYTVSTSDTWSRATIFGVTAKLSLVDAAGKERSLEPNQGALKPTKGWKDHGSYTERTLRLPSKLPDGDYKLRARVETRVGRGQVDLPLPLYAPARIHLLTDRPLYEPGHRVLLRALVVRARDLTPIDHRPGVWLVQDPNGIVLLEEKAPAGEWGVVAGDFLLDKQAPTGVWTATWRSGKDQAKVTFRVEPFKLPRFRLQASASKPFYGAGDRPRVSGAVIYASGAPVQGAKLELNWRVAGRWPAPASWTRGALPKKAKTDAAGRFSLELPAVPADLQGQATLSAYITAIDPAGDRVASATSVLLSKDPIAVSALTALSGGLIAGYNNRIYLRVTTADGRPLPGAKLSVRRAWSKRIPPIVAEADVDSVARIQFDPGPPVNVVIPPLPVRQLPREKQIVRRVEATDLFTGQDASLDDQVEIDRWLALLSPCAKLIASDGQRARVGLRVKTSGAVQSVAASSEVGRCVLGRLRGRRLPRASRPRLYALAFEFSDPPLPQLDQDIASATTQALPDGLDDLFSAASRAARDCLPKGYRGALPWALAWRVAKGKKKPAVSWLRAPGKAMPRGAGACILSRVKARALDEPTKVEAMGVVRYRLRQPYRQSYVAPQPRIVKGYELTISASRAGKLVGQTKLRMSPGAIPALTVRAEPVLARAGQTITVRTVRGPGFTGPLPRSMTVEHFGEQKVVKLPKRAKAGRFSYTIPAGKQGWFSFATLGQRALIFVRTAGELSVKVASDQPRYAPRAVAKLRITTRVGARPTKAAVGLFGVDESLAQLATLVGPDALRSVQPEVPMSSKAFGSLDGQALALGRIRGAYAAEATILRVASIPKPAEIDTVLNDQAKTQVDPVAELTDRFYVVLYELHRLARAWQKSAPRAEKMTPKKMAALWKRALEATEARGKRVDDAFGRRLRLHRLPADLLALTNPRQVITLGTRLPEDIEDWSRWVARRKP